MTRACLYHGNCPDGMTAAWAVWTHWGNDALYVPVQYNTPPPALPATVEELLIVDFAYPRAELQALAGRYRVTVLDHHKTAAADLAGLEAEIPIHVEFDMERSGAMLAWQYFAGTAEHEAPRIVRLAQDRDLWRFALPHSRALSYWLRGVPYELAAWEEAHRRLETEWHAVVAEASALVTFVDQQVEQMARHARDRWIGEWLVPVANATVLFSEVGERLCQLRPDVPFAAYYMDRGDGRRQWGLRSTGFDVAQVAQRYGGGGHRTAAGFTTALTWDGEADASPA